VQLPSKKRIFTIYFYSFLSSRAVFRKPFLPSLHNMRHIPFNDLHALEQTLACLQFTGDDAGKISRLDFIYLKYLFSCCFT
jgi:hypothetical protein